MKLKKIFISILSILVVFSVCSRNIYASGSVYVNRTTVNVIYGSSSTFSITASNAAGKISVSSNNTSVATVNVGTTWIENQTITVTVKGNSVGSTTIVVSLLDVADSDGNDISGKKISITVNVNERQEVVVGKSSIKSLGTLSVEGLSFEEEFTTTRTEYTLYAPLNTEHLNIKATAASSKAKLSEINGDVTEGWNNIEFTCTAEDGTSQKYMIKVYVEEHPDIYFLNDSLGNVKNLDKVETPEGFKQENIAVDGKELIVLNHKQLDLVYLMDNDGNKDFYIYDRLTNNISSKYSPVVINERKYIKLDVDYKNFELLDENYVPTVININENIFYCWKSIATNMEDYRILYLMNEDGIKCLYSYDTKEKTLQRFTIPEYPEAEKTQLEELLPTIYLCSAVAGTLCFLASLFISLRRNKTSI